MQGHRNPHSRHAPDRRPGRCRRSNNTNHSYCRRGTGTSPSRRRCLPVTCAHPARLAVIGSDTVRRPRRRPSPGDPYRQCGSGNVVQAMYSPPWFWLLSSGSSASPWPPPSSLGSRRIGRHPAPGMEVRIRISLGAPGAGCLGSTVVRPNNAPQIANGELWSRQCDSRGV